MSSTSRRPNYPLVLTTAVAIHRDVPVPAKLYVGAAAALPGRDPGVRRLAERRQKLVRELAQVDAELAAVAGIVRALVPRDEADEGSRQATLSAGRRTAPRALHDDAAGTARQPARDSVV